MRLIDTSAWIHALRADGDSAVASRVRALLETGEAAWCPMVQLEMWNGARGDHERRVIKEMKDDLIELEMDGPVWTIANAPAQLARRRGKTIPATDILIAACARRHGVELEHADQHFAVLAAFSD
jgi:predicted nucleic acid-binding protein